MSPSLPDLRRPPPLPHPDRHHGLICGSFLTQGGISVTQVQHMASAGPLLEHLQEGH